MNVPYYEEKEMGTETDYNKAPSIKTEEAIKESHKVLIVEDNETILDYVKKVLATCSESIHVVEARNGIEGYKQFKAEEPDLIFMDIVMPESDGYQATAMIRQEDQTVPIIALTAKALQGEKEECGTCPSDPPRG